MPKTKIKSIILFTAMVLVVSGCSSQLKIKNEELGIKGSGEMGGLVEEVATTTGEDLGVAGGSDKIDTNDWKVCKNNEIGLQLKYPSNWNCITAIGDKVSFFKKYYGQSESFILTNKEDIEKGLFFNFNDFYNRECLNNECFVIVNKEKDNTSFGIIRLYKNDDEKSINQYYDYCKGENEKYSQNSLNEDCVLARNEGFFRTFNEGNGPLFNYGIFVDGNYYEIHWDISSLKVDPDSMIAAYVHNIKSEEQWEIIKSIEKIK